MSYTEIQKKKLLRQVETLMKRCQIPIRDTWTGFEGQNFDDAISNNGHSGGPRLFDVIITEEGKAKVSDYQKYPIDKFNSLAYENYKVSIPKRLSHLTHPVIHETVHFLQHSTDIMDANYVKFDETTDNYLDYVSQRQELEAHFVQILYINEYEPDIIDKRYKKDFSRLIKNGIKNPSERLKAILYANNKGII